VTDIKFDMIRVVLESPYAGDIEANTEFARECMRDCLRRGESPYASHIFFGTTGVLDEHKPEERRLGIDAGLAWGPAAARTVVYIDRGISGGMLEGILRAERDGRPIQYRSLHGADTSPATVEPLLREAARLLAARTGKG